MIDFLKGTVGKDYFSDRLASKEPLSQPTNQSFTNRFIERGLFGLVLRLASYIRSRELGFRVPRIHGQLSIGNKLPQDALNPAHGSLLRVNSPSHEIFSNSINDLRTANGEFTRVSE